MAVWTLKHDGVTQTFAAWGLKGLRRTQASQAAGQVTFVRSGSYDATPLFAVDDEVIIYKDGVVWHVGPVLTVPRLGAARSEAQMYTVGDPWWYLENLVYNQNIALANDEGVIDLRTSTLVTMFAVIEGLEAGTYVKSTAQQMIATAVALAVTAGASMQVAFAGDFDLSPPIHELRDPTCAEVIRAVLRWLLDASMGWDYSTVDGEGNPRPTLRIARRGAATARTLDAGDGRTVNSINLTPRDDLRRDRVVIAYEITNTDGDETLVTYVHDVAGTGSPFRTLMATVPLSGYTRVYQEQTIETEPLAQNDASWWQANVPEMADTSDLSIEDATAEPLVEDGPSFSRRIVSGAYPPWMDAGGAGVMRVSAKGSYTKNNGGGAEARFTSSGMATDVPCTDLESGTYRTVVSESPGEIPPTGVAAAMQAALGEVMQDGSVLVKKRECAFIARPGDVLNVTNGVAAWATMRAPVQQVDEDIDAGETVITVGPPRQLDVQDLMGMLKTFRIGMATGKMQERATGVKEAGNETKGARRTPNDNGSASGAHWNRMVSVGPEGGELTLDADAGVKAEKGGKAVELDVEVPRLFLDDGGGQTLEIKADKIAMEKTGGYTMELAADKVVFTQGSVSATLSFEELVMAGAAAVAVARMNAERVMVENGANSTLLNDEQLVVQTASSMGVYEADNAYVSTGSTEATMSVADGLGHTDGTATAALSAADGMTHGDGSGTAEVSAAAGLAHEVGSASASVSAGNGVELADGSGATAELTASQLQMVDGSDSVTINPEAGFANTSTGQTAELGGAGGLELTASGGVTKVQAIAGENIENRSTTACVDGENGEAYFLRGTLT